jgi:hypothetical protein
MSKYVYHGSTKKIEGHLEPRKSTDLGNKPENLHTAVYAATNRDVAIAMAILGTGNIKGSSLLKGSAIYYAGAPDKNATVFLYVFPKDKFEPTKNPRQYISKVPVVPSRIYKIKVKDYLHLVREGTKEEKERFARLLEERR